MTPFSLTALPVRVLIRMRAEIPPESQSVTDEVVKLFEAKYVIRGR